MGCVDVQYAASTAPLDAKQTNKKINIAFLYSNSCLRFRALLTNNLRSARVHYETSGLLSLLDAIVDMATEFTLFPQLITELRLEIWRFALPDLLRRPLYRYKVGCWVIEEVGPQYEGDTLDPNGERLLERFDTSLLRPLHIPLPLYSVNREARDVAAKWLKEQELVACPGSTPSDFTFHRHFNSQTDTIFMPAADAFVFGGEPGDRFTVPEMEGRHASFPYSALPRLAITPAGLDALKPEPLDAFMVIGGVINTIYVVEVAPSSTLTLGEIEDVEGAFPLVGLEDKSHARLRWSSSRREWSDSGDDYEALVRLRQMVTGLEDVGSFAGAFDWDVRLVYLTTHQETSTSLGRL